MPEKGAREDDEPVGGKGRASDCGYREQRKLVPLYFPFLQTHVFLSWNTLRSNEMSLAGTGTPDDAPWAHELYLICKKNGEFYHIM